MKHKRKYKRRCSDFYLTIIIKKGCKERKFHTNALLVDALSRFLTKEYHAEIKEVNCASPVDFFHFDDYLFLKGGLLHRLIIIRYCTVSICRLRTI